MAAASGDADGYAVARARMIEVIQWHAASGPVATSGGGISAAVIGAMRRVPRHEFVPQSSRAAAYHDRPLPIGYGQTISQPYIVALMTDLLGAGAGQSVLEVGTGSGYQAAVLAELGIDTATIEVIPALERLAAARLERLGYRQVSVRQGDGYNGWPERAPFDGIIVTAAASHVPPLLVQQLATGGRMVIPVGRPLAVQQLMLITKDANGAVTTRQLLPVRFVPLTRGQ